jgi:hypothetical protein
MYIPPQEDLTRAAVPVLALVQDPGAGAGAVVRRRRFCSGTGQILRVRWHSMSRRLQCVETTGVQSRPTAS